jgi:hypothetical protein
MQGIDRNLLKLARVGQGCRPRRCSTDPARRTYYARHRTARLARLGK